MFSRLRRRFTYANVAMTLALVFAMSGGAFAASKYLISSTKQIKPSVLKQLKGNAGAAGAQGPAGTAGAQGPAGPAGPQGPGGAKGETGTPGKEGKAGTNGTNGKEGSPWTAGGTLPSKATETGGWSFGRDLSPEGQVHVPVASFTIPLAAPLSNAAECEKPSKPACQVHYLNAAGKEVLGIGEEVTSKECKGTAEKPTAEPGNFCVYTSEENNVLAANITIRNPGKGGSTTEVGTTGAVVIFVVRGAGPFGEGTWAVTAA